MKPDMPVPSGETIFSPKDPFGPEPKQQSFFGGPSDDGGEAGKTGVASVSAEEIPDDPAADRTQSEPDEVSVLRERLAKSDELMERLLTQRQVEPAPYAPAARELMAPPGPQPDAVTKPAEFTAWLDKKISYERALTERSMEVRSAQQDQASNLDRLWQQFQRDYAEDADDEDLVAAAFQRVVMKNGGRMPGDTNDLFGKISAQVKSWRGGNKGGEPSPARGRTNGIGAGAGAKKGGGKPAAQEDKPVKFTDQLADIQLKTGFF
jgi:hypothetical protein